MPSRPTFVARVLAAAFVALSLVAFPASVQARGAEETSAPKKALEFRAVRAAQTETDKSAWCANEFESLGNDVCYIDGRANKPRRTLVIWLHGVIAKNTTWSWNHQRMLARVAKHTGIEMLFPRGRESGTLYAWPGTAAAQEKWEQELIDEWMTAKAALERRDDRAFDEVFVFGFSSGAYFASSLAMRGRVDVDGYAVFAGGQSNPVRGTPVERFSPVFVGVCANDKTTASHSRAFAGSLSAAGIPRMVMEQKVGHDVSAAHFLGALSYLRNKAKPRVAALEIVGTARAI